MSETVFTITPNAYRHAFATNNYTDDDRQLYVDLLSHLINPENIVVNSDWERNRIYIPNSFFPSFTEEYIYKVFYLIDGAIYWDCPEVFHIYTSLKLDTELRQYYVESFKNITADNYYTILNDVYAAADEIISNIPDDASDYGKIYFLHDTVCDLITYGDKDNLEESYNIVGAFIRNVAVCEGYAEAFRLLCQRVGLKCIYVEGAEKNPADNSWNNHAWNYVELDGKWYMIDTTYDDGSTPMISRQGFLRGSNYANTLYQLEYEDGTESTYAYDNLPELDENDYDPSSNNDEDTNRESPYRYGFESELIDADLYFDIYDLLTNGEIVDDTIYNRIYIPTNLSGYGSTYLYNVLSIILRDCPELYHICNLPVRYDDATAQYYFRTFKQYTNSSYSDTLDVIGAALETLSIDINSSMTEYEKVLALHDAYCAYVTYGDLSGADAGTAYGALVNKRAVCEGFARGFLLLCQYNNIKCIYVEGQEKTSDDPLTYGNHAWNYIQVDGVWYHMDCTVDGAFAGTVGHQGFLKGNNYQSMNYKLIYADGSMPNSIYNRLPELSMTDYVVQPTMSTTTVAPIVTTNTPIIITPTTVVPVTTETPVVTTNVPTTVIPITTSEPVIITTNVPTTVVPVTTETPVITTSIPTTVEPTTTSEPVVKSHLIIYDASNGDSIVTAAILKQHLVEDKEYDVTLVGIDIASYYDINNIKENYETVTLCGCVLSRNIMTDIYNTYKEKYLSIQNSVANQNEVIKSAKATNVLYDANKSCAEILYNYILGIDVNSKIGNESVELICEYLTAYLNDDYDVTELLDSSYVSDDVFALNVALNNLDDINEFIDGLFSYTNINVLDLIKSVDIDDYYTLINTIIDNGAPVWKVNNKFNAVVICNEYKLPQSVLETNELSDYDMVLSISIMKNNKWRMHLQNIKSTLYINTYVAKKYSGTGNPHYGYMEIKPETFARMIKNHML